MTESTTTSKLSTWLVEHMSKPSNACIGLDSRAEQGERLGHRVLKAVQQLPQDRSGMITVAERWLAPDLNCLPLVETVSQRKDGKSTVVNQTEITSLKPGEPSPEYFSVPAGFTERPPSAVFAEYRRKYSKEKCEKCVETDRRLDEIYSIQQNVK